MQIFAEFIEAQAACSDEQTVCGTYRGKSPVYFLMPKNVDDRVAHDAAFEVQHGRPMAREEHTMANVMRLEEVLGARST